MSSTINKTHFCLCRHTGNDLVKQEIVRLEKRSNYYAAFNIPSLDMQLLYITHVTNSRITNSSNCNIFFVFCQYPADLIVSPLHLYSCCTFSPCFSSSCNISPPSLIIHFFLSSSYSFDGCVLHLGLIYGAEQ